MPGVSFLTHAHGFSFDGIRISARWWCGTSPHAMLWPNPAAYWRADPKCVKRAGSQSRAQRALRPAGAFHRTHTEGARGRQTHPTKRPWFQLYSSSSFSPTGKCRQKETRPAHCCERRVPIASLRGSFRDHSRKACGCAPRGLPAALGARREGSPGALRAS